MRPRQAKLACMVRRRSTVRFRNGAPGHRGFSNSGCQDQVTNQVMRLQLTAGTARRTQSPAPLWLAAIRLNATASDETARHCQEKVRIRPLPVSVAWRTAAAYPARPQVGYAECAEPVRMAIPPGSGTSPRLRVGDCSVLAEHDQHADACRARGMGASL